MLGIKGLLLRYKSFLSIALPALVCLDACHNAYVILRLYEEREKDWEMEKQQVLLDTVLPVMRGIAFGCQTQDKAFWPTSLAQALAPPVLSEPAVKGKPPVEEDGVLGMLGVLPRLIPADDSQAPSGPELREQSVGHHSTAALRSTSTAYSASTPHRNPPYRNALQWLAAQREGAAELGSTYLSGLVDRGLRSLRECVPMPCMVVRRRSALRVRLHWHGFAQPVAKPRAAQTCELML